MFEFPGEDWLAITCLLRPTRAGTVFTSAEAHLMDRVEVEFRACSFPR